MLITTGSSTILIAGCTEIGEDNQDANSGEQAEPASDDGGTEIGEDNQDANSGEQAEPANVGGDPENESSVFEVVETSVNEKIIGQRDEIEVLIQVKNTGDSKAEYEGTLTLSNQDTHHSLTISEEILPGENPEFTRHFSIENLTPGTWELLLDGDTITEIEIIGYQTDMVRFNSLEELIEFAISIPNYEGTPADQNYNTFIEIFPTLAQYDISRFSEATRSRTEFFKENYPNLRINDDDLLMRVYATDNDNNDYTIMLFDQNGLGGTDDVQKEELDFGDIPTYNTLGWRGDITGIDSDNNMIIFGTKIGNDDIESSKESFRVATNNIDEPEPGGIINEYVTKYGPDGLISLAANFTHPNLNYDLVADTYQGDNDTLHFLHNNENWREITTYLSAVRLVNNSIRTEVYSSASGELYTNELDWERS